MTDWCCPVDCAGVPASEPARAGNCASFLCHRKAGRRHLPRSANPVGGRSTQRAQMLRLSCPAPRCRAATVRVHRRKRRLQQRLCRRQSRHGSRLAGSSRLDAGLSAVGRFVTRKSDCPFATPHGLHHIALHGWLIRPPGVARTTQSLENPLCGSRRMATRPIRPTWAAERWHWPAIPSAAMMRADRARQSTRILRNHRAARTLAVRDVAGLRIIQPVTRRSLVNNLSHGRKPLRLRPLIEEL